MSGQYNTNHISIYYFGKGDNRIFIWSRSEGIDIGWTVINGSKI